MKKTILYTAILCFITLTTAIAQKTNNTPSATFGQNFEDAQEYLFKMKANLETGRIDPSDVLKARQAADKMAANRSEKSVAIDWEFMGPDNIGGDTRAIIIDKDNPQRLIAGSVSGGIFTSNDGGLNWIDHPQNTEFAGLSIAALAQGPDGAIYAGTGVNFDGRNYGQGKLGDSVLSGNGMYKSTDGGNSFEVLTATIPVYEEGVSYNTDWAVIKAIEVNPADPNKVYVATSRGLQVSQDGGMTWVKANGIAVDYRAYSIAIASDGKTHVLADSTYYRAEDGLNFTSKFGGRTQFIFPKK